MRDIRTDYTGTIAAERKPAREEVAPRLGTRLIVVCDARDCDHAVRIDPRPLFGGHRAWPVAGRSSRFRCRCGSRETTLSYTVNRAQTHGPISCDAIRLWT